MALSKLNPEQGRLLVSEPFLTDWYFRRAVILITEHNNEGSLGFILNKPVRVSLNEAVPDFPSFDAALFVGGPVKNDSLFFIHTAGDRIEESLEISKGLFWGGDYNQLKDLVLTDRISPHEIRFFIGYSGWAPEQLDKELTQQSWVIASGRVKQIMDDQTDSLWKSILKKMGTEFSMLSNFPENPSLN